MSVRKQRSKYEYDPFINLMGQAMILWTEGKRGPDQEARFMQALQGFKENRLGGVELLDIPTDLTKEQIHELLSKPLGELDFTSHTRRNCRQMGIQLIGELYQFNWNNNESKAGQEVKRSLRRLGLPSELNLAEIGWRPAYVDDVLVRNAWDTPIGEVLHQNPWSPTHKVGNSYYVGELLRTAVKHPYGKEFQLACSLNTLVYENFESQVKLREGVHAAMLVLDWEAPTEIPAGAIAMTASEEHADGVRGIAEVFNLTGGDVVKKRTRLLGKRMVEAEMNPYLFRRLVGCNSFSWERLAARPLYIKGVKELLSTRPDELERKMEGNPTWKNSRVRELEDALAFWGLKLGMPSYSGPGTLEGVFGKAK